MSGISIMVSAKIARVGSPGSVAPLARHGGGVRGGGSVGGGRGAMNHGSCIYDGNVGHCGGLVQTGLLASLWRGRGSILERACVVCNSSFRRLVGIFMLNLNDSFLISYC